MIKDKKEVQDQLGDDIIETIEGLVRVGSSQRPQKNW